MADEPVLQMSESGEWVQYLQQMLQHNGYWSAEADGQFGEPLADAVKEFQGAWGLTTDGVVGPVTWGKLTGKVEEFPSETSEKGEPTILISGEEYPELTFLLSCETWEDWAEAIGLDVEFLQSDDDEVSV
jgi:peptidoglycan hydrolase-like protein with peptidoglycan-binding domain